MKHYSQATLVALIAASLFLSVFVPASASPTPAKTTKSSELQKRDSYEAYWWNKCSPLLQFLRSHGVPSRYTWANYPKNSTGCCNFDASDLNANPPIIRKVTCIEGVLDTVTWGPNDLTGPLSDSGFADATNINSATGESTYKWTKIDFSGNPGLIGAIPRWMAGAGGTLKTLNLSGTGISGQLPRLDILLPKLVTLDVSNSKMTGYVNKLPDTLITCGTSGTGMCYYKESSWAGITPASCIATLPQCAGTAPSAAAPPYPDPIRPHWTDISNYEAAGLKSIEGQCDALRAWLVAHEYDEAALWKAGTKCCNWGSISCYNSWAITSIYFGGTGLRGNINEPANTLSELKALQGIDLGYNKLSGAFPTFLLGMPDLSTIDLSYNQLTGSVVDLLPLERLRSLEFQGNQLTGSIPLLVSRNSSYGCGCSTCGCGSSYLYTCKIEGAPNDKLCWKYDPIFYDANCVMSNPSIPQCASTGEEPVYSKPVESTSASNWSCVRSCQDFGHYVKVRTLNSVPARVQCQGPNTTACSWYLDDKCSNLAPNEPTPANDTGVICSQYVSGWCAAAATALANPTAKAPDCAVKGSWTCVRSCSDKGNSVLVRSIGTQVDGGTVQCQGPDGSKCSWYEGGDCKVIAAGEPAPDKSGELGMYCTQLEAGWCKLGSDAVFKNVKVTDCNTATATGTVTVVTGTATAGPAPTATTAPLVTSVKPNAGTVNRASGALFGAVLIAALFA